MATGNPIVIRRQHSSGLAAVTADAVQLMLLNVGETGRPRGTQLLESGTTRKGRLGSVSLSFVPMSETTSFTYYPRQPTKHNHPAYENPANCAGIRRHSQRLFGTKKLDDIIATTSEAGGSSSEEIARDLCREHPNLLIYGAHVRSTQKRLLNSVYGPSSSTQAFLDQAPQALQAGSQDTGIIAPATRFGSHFDLYTYYLNASLDPLSQPLSQPLPRPTSTIIGG
ncbi:uncharacterized protein BBA_10341 [Beauveria bassiana ARSEF 2860]|uniref:Uncharacterized protein n=1 Tax=Beauveria bassiana (strain ARSEF 2860) TaxID=655819 RepID=J4VPR2_BEAB2|nr:uncharacterized protein BBA_10341 [Beauveria bassiana ARSEF 2860]EJP60710.1 hypothetical protein BBA_10341 [Beauveria bassiana ARSEF 2860]